MLCSDFAWLRKYACLSNSLPDPSDDLRPFILVSSQLNWKAMVSKAAHSATFQHVQKHFFAPPVSFYVRPSNSLVCLPPWFVVDCLRPLGEQNLSLWRASSVKNVATLKLLLLVGTIIPKLRMVICVCLVPMLLLPYAWPLMFSSLLSNAHTWVASLQTDLNAIES